MSSPGEYLPDATAGITDPKNLPKAILKKKSRLKKKCRCPFCRRPATRHGTRTRTLHDLGDLGSGRPVEVQLKHSTHYCCKCGKYFNVDTTDIAAPKSEYTKAVVDLAIRLIVEDQLPLREASWHLWRDHRVFVPFSTLENWVEAAGKKKTLLVETDEYLDWAFEHFSGYIAIDEVYDGPFCILFIVDNHEYKRLVYRVLDHNAKAEDILEILKALQKMINERKLEIHGVTTDGSKLYTEQVHAVFPGVIHQICEFHTKQDINKAVLKDATKIRRELKQTMTKRTKRGRPKGVAEKQTVLKNAQIQSKLDDLFKNRYLSVKKKLTVKERKTFQKITQGLPVLRKLRKLIDDVYRLYDRRCRKGTALNKLRRLRRAAKRSPFPLELSKALESPMLEASLRFLDDKQCPSTSNAVERCNRRFRKTQKSVYRVRTQEHIKQRIALDMFRDRYTPGCRQVMTSLHDARSGKNQPP